MKIWLNGKFVDREKANISVFDHGLLYGDGVFEGIRAYDGRVFRLKEHLDRLYNSAKAILLKIPLSKEQMGKAVLSAVRKNKLHNAYIRLVVTRGPGDLGLDPRKCRVPSMFIIVDKIVLYSQEYYTNGLKIITAATRRNPPCAISPHIKSLNYLNNILAKIEAIKADVPEAIMLNEKKQVVECTGDNVFIIKNGKLISPPTSAGALPGITRNAVMELARRKLSEGEDAVSRIDENSEKKNSGDFCLWKFKKEGEPSWKTSLGEGRPGWHIEDTAITEKEFGSQYDIHGGGLDLIFPHHEAEIAQMESISGKKPLVRYWMHTGFLNIGKEKMGKSKGNFSTIRELIKLYSSEEIRYLFLSANYRKPIDFSPESLENAKSSLERLKNICDSITNDGKTNKNCLNEFEESMDDDFNTPNALQVLWKLVRDENANGKYQTIKKLDEIFGLKLLEKIEIKIPKKVNEFLEKREIARKNKKWEEADKLRDEIKSLGFQVLDGKEGQEIKEV